MQTRNLARVMLALAAITGSPGFAHALTSTESCTLDKYTPLQVVPLMQTEDHGLGAYERLNGARIFVAAKPGVTANKLRMRMLRDLKSPRRGQLSPMCRPNVRNVDVSVKGQDDGYWISLSANDERSARAILGWVRRGLPTSHFATRDLK